MQDSATAPEFVTELPENIDEDVRILQFIQGEMDGKPFWAYLAMFPSKFQEYSIEVEAGNDVDLMAYGEPLAQGWGTEPPKDVKEKMVREYGAQENFEQQLKAALEEAIAAEKNK